MRFEEQEADSMDQFDYALNLDVGFVLNDELFEAQLQTGPEMDSGFL